MEQPRAYFYQEVIYMPKHLSIDIETYSDIDIGKCGLFKYCDSEAFENLLFAYS